MVGSAAATSAAFLARADCPQPFARHRPVVERRRRPQRPMVGRRLPSPHGRPPTSAVFLGRADGPQPFARHRPVVERRRRRWLAAARSNPWSVDDVDAEGRATELRPLALSRPHTQAFHLAWLSLFACFFAAFAAPPILPALRPALVLPPSDASAAAVASLAAALVGRLAMGPACNLLGPRRASGVASLVCALALALAAVYASSPAGFVALRFCAGLSVSNFVANQHWMSASSRPPPSASPTPPSRSVLDGGEISARI